MKKTTSKTATIGGLVELCHTEVPAFKNARTRKGLLDIPGIYPEEGFFLVLPIRHIRMHALSISSPTVSKDRKKGNLKTHKT